MPAGRPQHRVVVVAPVHDRRETTLRWLRNLAALDRDGLDVAVVVVDDGSTDGTAEAVANEFPSVEIVRGDGTLWYTAGTNRGLEAALARDPDSVLAMNDDVLLDRGALVALVRLAESRPRSVVAPLLILREAPERVVQVAPEWRVKWGGWIHWAEQRRDTVPAEPFEVEGLVGNALLLPADAIRECGLLDAKNLPHYGDAEYAGRLRRAGWRLLVDPRVVAHCEPGTLPPRLSSLSAGGALRHLVFDRTSGHSLWTRFFANARVAPSRSAALAASAVYVGRVALRALGVANALRRPSPEPPLRDVLAARRPPAPDPAPLPAVVYAWPYLEWGGAQTYFLSLMRRARGRFRVRAVVPDGTSPALVARLAEAGAEVAFVNARLPLSAGGGVAARVARRVARLRAERAFVARLLAPDLGDALLHVDLDPGSSAAALARLALARNVFVTVHTGLPEPRGLRRRLAAARVRALSRLPRFRLLAANLDAKRSLAAYLSPREQSRVALSPSAFDRDDVDAARAAEIDAALLERLGLDLAKPRVFTAGRFVERKGRSVLLDAARRLGSRGVEATFVWLAPEPADAEAEALVASHGLGTAFRLLSPRDFGDGRVDLFRLLRTADVFALPSFREGLPLALVEAMALGLACVATSVNGVPEVVVDGVTGLLVPPGDPEALAGALARLLGDAEDRRRLGEAARALAFRRYDDRRTTEATFRAYEDALPP